MNGRLTATARVMEEGHCTPRSLTNSLTNPAPLLRASHPQQSYLSGSVCVCVCVCVCVWALLLSGALRYSSTAHTHTHTHTEREREKEGGESEINSASYDRVSSNSVVTTGVTSDGVTECLALALD